MRLTTLERTPVETIIAAFTAAFADYSLPMYLPASYWKKRWRVGRVDYALSLGAFDQSRLIGFMIMGVDEWQGYRTAFNLGTGVLPSYRGRHLVQRMYEFGIPLFLKNNIRQCALEVLQDNAKAIKAYQNSGLAIHREFCCLAGSSPSVGRNKYFQFQTVTDFDAARYAPMNSYPYSWENNAAAIALNNSTEIWEMSKGADLFGYFILDTGKNHLVQIGVKDNKWQYYGEALWSKIAAKMPELKCNNVDARDTARLKFLKMRGMQPSVQQYEMRRRL